MSEAPSPRPPDERIDVIDVLRGFALFGILPVNVLGFSAPLYFQLLGFSAWPPGPDHAALRLIYFLAVGKFYSLFAFLFGVGFAVQIERAAVRRRGFLAPYGRRLSTLALFGAAHAFLLWWGDVLLLYAALGAVLIAFRAAEVRAIVIAAVVSLSIPAQLVLLETISAASVRTDPAEARALDREARQTRDEYRVRAGEAVDAYRGGDAEQIFEARLGELETQYERMGLMLPHVFAMMLAGLAAGRARLFASTRFFRRALPFALVVGVGGNAVFVLAQELADPLAPSWTTFAGAVSYIVGAPALALAYAATIVLAYETGLGRRFLSWLAPVGRMALTTYLLQSVVCTTLCYGHGFGLYGRIGPLAGCALAVGLFATQAALSRTWLRQFRFGPAEWIWRSATYLRLPPIRRDPSRRGSE